jgi:hypothetical protein
LNQFGEQLAKYPYSRVEVSALAMMQVSVIELHSKSVSHKRGLELLSATRAVDGGIEPETLRARGARRALCAARGARRRAGARRAQGALDDVPTLRQCE